MARLVNPGIEHYEDRLRSLPPSGGGGCHTALLGCANVGVRAGIDPERVFEDLRQHVHGSRPVSDREIREAVTKAASESRAPVPALTAISARYPGKAHDGKEIIRRLSEPGRGCQDVDLAERSPVRIDWPPEEDAWHVIEALYGPDEQLYIGPPRGPVRPGHEIRAAADWIGTFRASPPPFPHIIPNPLTGRTAPRADGSGTTLRGDACVAAFRYAVVEFDELSREEQLAFWWSARLPVAVLVDSGGKSIHGWIRVQGVYGADGWTRVVEEYLFGRLLNPLGVDGACRNESRLSRLPGHWRQENGNWQRLLYLAPGGKAVAA
jgi:hypothetical protein